MSENKEKLHLPHRGGQGTKEEDMTSSPLGGRGGRGDEGHAGDPGFPGGGGGGGAGVTSDAQQICHVLEGINLNLARIADAMEYFVKSLKEEKENG